jgi:hypothetical protein
MINQSGNQGRNGLFSLSTGAAVAKAAPRDPRTTIAPILTSAAKNTYYTGLSTPITPSRASTQTRGRSDDSTRPSAAGHEFRLAVAFSSCEIRSAVEAQPPFEPWSETSPSGCIGLTAALVWTRPFFLQEDLQHAGYGRRGAISRRGSDSL